MIISSNLSSGINAAQVLTKHLDGGTMAGQKTKRIRSEKSKQKQGDKMKALWADPAYRERHSIGTKDAWTEERRDAARKRMSERMNQPKAKDAARQRIALFNSTDAARLSRKATSSKNWKNAELKERMLSGMLESRSRRTTEPTDFERRCYRFLDEIGIQYVEQFAIGAAKTIVDAYVPDQYTCIYFDSAYWHEKPENKRRDIEIRERLAALGYTVLVITSDRWAREINKSDLAVVKEVLCGLR